MRQRNNLKLNTMKINYCINCEEQVRFIKGRCEKCKGKYDDVVPASYRNYKYETFVQNRNEAEK
jgi:predicted amidophosphoribosyltransferase